MCEVRVIACYQVLYTILLAAEVEWLGIVVGEGEEPVKEMKIHIRTLATKKFGWKLWQLFLMQSKSVSEVKRHIHTLSLIFLVCNKNPVVHSYGHSGDFRSYFVLYSSQIEKQYIQQ